MNIYGVIILSTILIEFILNLIADLLNLDHLSGKLPDEFKDIYDAETYQKSQTYTRVNTRFGFLTSSFGLGVILIFWFAGGFNTLDSIIRNFGLHPIWTGLIYIGFLIFSRFLISLPFSIYATFVIEERFGFNKTTPVTFVKDIIKGLLLSILIGGPLLGGVLAFFQYAGSLAWLYCWSVTTCITLFLQYIAPTWIMPLFNKFTPLEDGDLKESILSYAQSVKYPLSGIFVMDGSKRSTKSNAFFTGFGKNKRIALFDTLIEKHTIPEMVAVLAHEIGHYKKKHILRGMIISILHMGIMFYLLSLFISHQGLFEAFYMNQTSIYAGMLFFGLLYSPIELILSILMNIFSRRNERQADHFAVETTQNPKAMIDALKKLSLHNLSNLRPHPFFIFLNYSHPPVLQRINNLRKMKLKHA
jgi:STE24 endopeptidase